MLIDAQALLSDAQAVTTDVISTNVYDLGVAGRNVGVGEPMAIWVQVDVSADYTTTDETYSFIARSSAAAAMSSPVDLATVTISAASSGLAAGTVFAIPIPPNLPATMRYIGLYYDTGGTTPSITCTAWIAPLTSGDRGRQYADGLTIS